MHNASSLVRLYDLDGTLQTDVQLAVHRHGHRDRRRVVGRADHARLHLVRRAADGLSCRPGDAVARRSLSQGELPPGFDAARYEVHQEWYPSRDGTRISMFVIHRRGLARGNNPTLLTGYGGFNVSRTPQFVAALPLWLDAGGVYALPNLRGGGEYGEAWHQAGMLGNKQNVFDDFIAAAEWLIANGYTTAERLAISGGSNGGLLVGAALTQRPDLFRAVVCQVPLLDMLRYQNLRIARLWIPEYGSAEDAEQFRWLYAYSPYHHVSAGVALPGDLFADRRRRQPRRPDARAQDGCPPPSRHVLDQPHPATSRNSRRPRPGQTTQQTSRGSDGCLELSLQPAQREFSSNVSRIGES